MSAQEVPPSDNDAPESRAGDPRFGRLRNRKRVVAARNPAINLRPGEVPADLPSATFVRAYEEIDAHYALDDVTDGDIRAWVGG